MKWMKNTIRMAVIAIALVFLSAVVLAAGLGGQYLWAVATGATKDAEKIHRISGVDVMPVYLAVKKNGGYIQAPDPRTKKGVFVLVVPEMTNETDIDRTEKIEQGFLSAMDYWKTKSVVLTKDAFRNKKSIYWKVTFSLPNSVP